MATDQDHITIASNGGTRPIPDPTELTDRAIAKALAAMTDYVDGHVAVLNERLNGIDTATKLRLQTMDHVPAQMDEKVGNLADLTNERFASAERLRVEQKKDTKDAVDAALSAAKEAVKEQTTASERSIAKSEGATSKQLDQIQETFQSAIDGLRRSLDDIKEARAEDNRQLRQSISDVASTANGPVQQKVGATENRTALYATIGLIVTIGIITMSVLSFVLAHVP